MCNDAAITTYAELLAMGGTRRSIETSVDLGYRARLRRGVYAATHACEPRRTAALHGGAIACITAARHVGLWILSTDEKPHVWLRASGHGRAHEGCICVEHWNYGGGDHPFALPPVPLILRQILGCLGIEEFFVAVESALRLKLLDRAGVDWLRRNTNREARRALELARSDADSGLESLLRWRLRRFRLSVRTQVAIPSTGRVDLLIGGRLIVEADGRDNHAASDHRHRDLVRDANSAMWGYSTLRFDYAMIVHDWDLVERAILGRLETLR